MYDIKLTSLSKASGCAAKIGPGMLSKVLKNIPKSTDKNLLVGTDTSDDGCVYKLTEELAIIQTLDFFTPIVDDPYNFGAIAATNALSDIYAMGGEPITALNIVAFPDTLDFEILGDIIKGGSDKVIEAGASLVGGHSIIDDVPKYGLSVTGIVNPNKIYKNFGAKEGDVLILTKPLGIGLINTAIKAKEASKKNVDDAIKSMTTLNKYAKEVCDNLNIHACTDVTGFGLAGHAFEMASASNVLIEIDTSKLIVLDGALDFAREGLVPAGSYRNRAYAKDFINTNEISDELIDLVYDPQTSGGLLIAIDKDEEEKAMKLFKEKNMTTKAYTIGKVVTGKGVKFI